MRSPLVLSAIIGASVIAAKKDASTVNGCNDGFFPGNDTVIYTTPYTYAQVMSIIGDYQNLTWSGSPEGSVTLNGTNNKVGTARTYDIGGVHFVETITAYSKPKNGPYEEIHTLNLITVAAASVSVYADYDGTTVTSTCDGKASIFNLTANYCANNASIAGNLMHMVHLSNAETVGKFLGGDNFTTCDAIGITGSASGLMVSMSSVLLAVGVLGLAGM